MPQATSAANPHSSLGRYVAVWAALVALTATTYAVSRVNLGAFNLPIALAIATLKASLVVVFFMHLWQHAPANRLVFLTALVFVALLMTLTVADLATRFPLARPPGPWFSEQPLPP
jgi:cytochrome c oxidase subunit 4